MIFDQPLLPCLVCSDLLISVMSNRILLEIGVQIAIVFVGGAAFQVMPISGREWGISLALGFVSIPWSLIIRLLSTKPFESLFKAFRLVCEEEVLPVVKPDREGLDGAISMVWDNLNIFSIIRGSCLCSSSFVLKSRQARLPQEDQLRMYDCNHLFILVF
jgi:Ca2+-transporting ATPase